MENQIKEMGSRIKEVRKNFKLTQTDFGVRIGVKGNTITNYENGLRTPSDAVILSICREFNVSEQWLRNGTGDMFIELTRDKEIAAFAGDILRTGDDTFKKRFVSMLASLEESDWEVLEKMAIKIYEEKKKD